MRGPARVSVVRHGYFPEDPRVRRDVAALAEAGFEVDVICMRRAGERRTDVWRGVKVHRVGREHHRSGPAHYAFEYASFFVRALVWLSMMAPVKRMDIVQVHTMPDFLVFTSVVPKALGARVVLDVHELVPELLEAEFEHQLPVHLRKLALALERWAIGYADVAVAVSDLQRRLLAHRTGTDFLVIPNVPEEMPPGEPPNGAPADVPVVVTHGSMLKRYGPDVLVRALPEVLQHVRVNLYLIGDGEYLPTVRAEVRRLGLQDHVTFTGRVPPEDIPAYMTQATVGVLPFLADGYMRYVVPNKLFDYVAHGVPVVAADLPGIRSYFDDTQVTYFKPGDSADLAMKIVGLLSDPGAGVGLASQASRVYQAVRWSTTRSSYVSMIRALAEQRRS